MSKRKIEEEHPSAVVGKITNRALSSSSSSTTMPMSPHKKKASDLTLQRASIQTLGFNDACRDKKGHSHDHLMTLVTLIWEVASTSSSSSSSSSSSIASTTSPTLTCSRYELRHSFEECEAMATKPGLGKFLQDYCALHDPGAMDRLWPRYHRIGSHGFTTSTSVSSSSSSSSLSTLATPNGSGSGSGSHGGGHHQEDKDKGTLVRVEVKDNFFNWFWLLVDPQLRAGCSDNAVLSSYRSDRFRVIWAGFLKYVTHLSRQDTLAIFVALFQWVRSRSIIMDTTHSPRMRRQRNFERRGCLSTAFGWRLSLSPTICNNVCQVPCVVRACFPSWKSCLVSGRTEKSVSLATRLSDGCTRLVSLPDTRVEKLQCSGIVVPLASSNV